MVDNKYFLNDRDSVLDGGKEYVLRVKDLPDQERPREKMLKYGSKSLSVAELLAVILGVGTRKEEVLTMAQRILKEYGEKTITSETNPKNLESELGVPIVKACQIVACFELGRRFYEKKEGRPVFIRTAKQAFCYLEDMHNLKKEHLRGLYLNSRYQIIHDEIISVGSLTSSIIHPREVFRPAIERSAVAVIVAHNHPSGTPKPTASDIEVTRNLIEAGKILGIALLDHIVVAKKGFVSIFEEGKFDEKQEI